MKRTEYIEGKKATGNFEEGMKALFKVPQDVVVKAEKKKQKGRVARVFDFAGIGNTVGYPVLRVLCEEPALSLSKGAGHGNACA